MAKGAGEVKSVSSGGKSGYGFTVNDDAGKPVVTFAFQSKEIADKAKERITKLLDRAAWISAG